MSQSSHIEVNGTVEQTSRLCHFLHHYASLCSGVQGIDTDASALTAAEARLVVDNKYFTAQAGFTMCTGTAAAAAAAASTAEALVVVMSAEAAAALRLTQDTEVAAVLSAAKAAGIQAPTQSISSPENDRSPSYAVQLLVTVADPANGEALTEVPQPTREALVGWCCTHNFELIELDASSTSALCCTHDEREKEGLPRLVEALSSHMWASAVNKSQKKGPTGTGGSSGGYSTSQPAPTASEVGPEVAAAVTASAAAAAAAVAPAAATAAATPGNSADKGAADANPFMPKDPSLEEDTDDPDTAVFSLLNQARAVRSQAVCVSLFLCMSLFLAFISTNPPRQTLTLTGSRCSGKG